MGCSAGRLQALVCHQLLAQGRNRLQRPDRTVTNRGTKTLDQPLGHILTPGVIHDVLGFDHFASHKIEIAKLVKRFGAAMGDGAIRALKLVPALR